MMQPTAFLIDPFRPMASSERLQRYGAIHTRLDELGWDETAYYSALEGMFGVGSKTDLSIEQLDAFIQMLDEQLVETGKLPADEVEWGWGKNKYESLRGRPGHYANPDQLRLVEATWREVARNPSQKALTEFLSNHVGIDHIIWLEQDDVRKVLIALKEMAKQQGLEVPFDIDEEDADDAAEDVSTGDREPVEPRSRDGAAERVDLSELSQTDRLLWWLRNEGPITPLEAEKKLGIGRLAARVYDLRQEGYEIETNEKEVETQFGGTSTVAHYRLTDTENAHD